MTTLINKFGPSTWQTYPWQMYRSPLQTLRVNPTLVVCEAAMAWLLKSCYLHAKQTNNMALFSAAMMCSMLPAFPKRVSWHSNDATIMLSPREPLFQLEWLICTLYASTICARRLNLAITGEACMALLMSYVMRLPFDVNGPRFLWFTWSDNRESIVGKREVNVPYFTSLRTAIWTGMFAALSRVLLFNQGDNHGVSLKKMLKPLLPEHGMLPWSRVAPILEMNTSQSSLVGKCLVMLVTIPLASCYIQRAVEIIALDEWKRPTKNSLRLLLGLCVVIAARDRILKGNVSSSSLTAHVQEANLTLYQALTIFGVVQAVIRLVSTKHVAAIVCTGSHESFGQKDANAQTSSFLVSCRDSELGGSPPLGCAHNEYEFVSKNEDKTYDARGHRILVPGKSHSTWYTIRGSRDVPVFRLAAERFWVFTSVMVGNVMWYGSLVNSA